MYCDGFLCNNYKKYFHMKKSVNWYLVILLLFLYYLIMCFGGTNMDSLIAIGSGYYFILCFDGRPWIGRKETGLYEIIYGTYGRVYQLCV